MPGYHPNWSDNTKTIAAVSARLRATKGRGKEDGADGTPTFVFGPEGSTLRDAGRTVDVEESQLQVGGSRGGHEAEEKGQAKL